MKWTIFPVTHVAPLEQHIPLSLAITTPFIQPGLQKNTKGDRTLPHSTHSTQAFAFRSQFHKGDLDLSLV